MAARAAKAAAAAAGGQSSNTTDPFTGRSLADVIRASNTTADPSQTSIGTTGGLMQGVRAGNLMSGVNQATGVTGGLMQDALAGMTSGVGAKDDFRSTTEERLTALEGGGEGQQIQPSVNTLESGAVSDFIPQNQQKVIGSVVDGNKPTDRGINYMVSKRNL